MIPKILHYVWIGPRKISDEAKRLIDGWHKVMPDYEIMEWNNDNSDFSHPFIRDAFSVGAWSRVSNCQRMTALINHGGIYLDTDVEMRKSFDPLLNHTCFFGFQSYYDSSLVNGAVIGAQKNHWFIHELRDYLNNEMFGAEYVGDRSGPGLITKLLKTHGLTACCEDTVNIKDITLFPRRYFYPYSWEETFSESCVTPDTYAIHLWENTWGKAPQTRFARLRKRIHTKLRLEFVKHAPDLAFKLAFAKAVKSAKG